MDLIYLIISTLFFLGGTIFSVIALRAGQFQPGNVNMALIGGGFVFQCLFLHLRGELHARCPITDGAEILIFVAWSLTIMYFILGRAFRLSLVGAFTAPILTLLQGFALILNWMYPVEARKLVSIDPWLEMHKSMSLLAYGSFALAAIASVMYLIQNRQLRSGRPNHLSSNLPPIRYLADALVRLLSIGLLLLTIGVVTAFFMQKGPSALHLLISGGVWVIYAGILIYQIVKRPAAKWLSFASLIAFAIALLTLSAI